jgi:hypothetical protein
MRWLTVSRYLSLGYFLFEKSAMDIYIYILTVGSMPAVYIALQAVAKLI